MSRPSILLPVLLLVAAPAAWSWAFTDHVVAEGKKMKAVAGWPEGTMALINHPLRTDGYHPFFSECPNDLYYFGLDVESPADLHRLIRTFAKIEAKELVVTINAEEAASHAGGTGALFSLGNQHIIDDWFKDLKVEKDGRRVFGVHRYTEPPKAQPPTLVIYGAHPAVEIPKLSIPAHITVQSKLTIKSRRKHKDLCDRIEDFVARRPKSK